MPGPGSYWIGEEEKQEVLDVIESGRLSRYGDLNDPRFLHKVITLEQEFAAYIGVRHAVATSSGTSCLFISFLVNGLKPGDEVIIPAYGYVATYTAAIFAGLAPVPAEIDDSLTLDPHDAERRITPRTKAIVPIHMLGNPADMEAIGDLARKYGLLIIEDGCQAAGAAYKGRKVGSSAAVRRSRSTSSRRSRPATAASSSPTTRGCGKWPSPSRTRAISPPAAG